VPQQPLDELLSRLPFFAGMTEDELDLIAGCGRNVHFAEGETILRQGDPADSFYVIRHGSVAVGNFVPPRGEIVIEAIHDGEILGWSWLFPPYRAHFDARAMTDVRATQFDGKCLRDKSDADTAFGLDIARRFAQVLMERLQWTSLRLLDMYGNGRGV
jgi:CRP/FNR family cyclic AMP-dependent transcriptional regulator